MDNIQSSHIKKKLNNKFHEWLNKMHGKYKEIKVYCGKHEYLGMNFDFSEPGK